VGKAVASPPPTLKPPTPKTTATQTASDATPKKMSKEEIDAAYDALLAEGEALLAEIEAETTDEDRIRRIPRAWHEAVKEQNTSKLLELCAPNAVFLSSTYGRMKPSGVCAEYKKAFDMGIRIEGESDVWDVKVEGDMGYYWAEMTTKATVGSATGSPIVKKYYTTTVVKQVEKHKWVIVHDVLLERK
jgi:ketosteroid isomerase-like protein